MKSTFIRFALRILLPKAERTRIPLSGEAARANDDYEIRLENMGEPENRSYLVRSMQGKIVNTEYWESDTAHPVDFSVDQIRLSCFQIQHYYRGWRIRYSSLFDAVAHEVLKLNWLKQVLQRAYDRRLETYRDRHELLRTLVSMRQPWPHDRIAMNDLLVRIYGQKIVTSERRYHHEEHLSFLLRSLAVSGDVEVEGEHYVRSVRPLPQALRTVSDYELDASHHRDSIRITRYQLLVAIAMMVLAAGTLAVKVLEQFVGK